MARQLRVTQTKSGIGRPEKQLKVLQGLGLGRTHKTKVLEDSAAVRGMIRKVQHLVVVEAVE